jgi:autoinducer 2 (AI-2) kinase
LGEELLVALDLGGGGVRCLVAGVASGTTAVASRAWTPERNPDLPTASEIDPEAVWPLLHACVREALDRLGADPARIAGIAATSMRHASALLDADGRELLITTNQDARGLADSVALAAEHGEELHRRTGHWPNPVQPAGRMRWLAREDPELWKRVAVHLSLSDWLGYRLSGELASEPSQAAETLLFDLARRDWAPDLIDRLALPRSLFPPVRDAGSALGSLRSSAAADLGLPAGIPVAVGGGDTQCALLGAGIIDAGALGIVTGTTAPVQMVAPSPVLDDDARLWSSPHLLPERWVIESNGGGMGTALEWIAGLLYPESPHPILRFFAEAARSVPGASGMVSTLGAEVMDARRFGLPVGNLTLSYLSAAGDPERRRHLARSVAEGFAYALRANAEQAEASAGATASAVRMAGGLSRNAFFSQLLCDVLGRPLDVAATPEATALGAAICAGVGAGVFADLAAGAAQLARTARSHAPGPASATHAELYPAWSSLRQLQSEADAAAGALAIRGMLSQPAAVTARTPASFRPRMLVTAELDAAGLAALREIGEVEHASFKQTMRLLTGRSLVEALEGVEVFITEVDVVDAASLARAADLRVIGVCRGDAVNVDLEACTALGIPVLNTPGRNADAVADLTLTYLLMLARRMPTAAAFLREPDGEGGDMGRMGRAFATLQGRELWGKTVGLVGMGAVGRKVIERLRPFGASCLVSDPYVDEDTVRLAGAEPASLASLLAASDFVSLHAAVTEETTGLIGARELERMRQGACLVNTARAALVDQEALVGALASGHLGGAALDVFAVEPPASDDPLLAFPNVIATPHIGGNTAEVAAHQARILAADLACLRSGQPPRNLMNPEVLASFDWSVKRPAPSAELRAQLERREAPAVTDLEKQAKRSPKRPAAATAPLSAAAEATRQVMDRVLDGVVARLLRDDALAEFAAGSEVVLHFTVTDLALEFWFGFHAGGLVGGRGAPADEADVQLKLRADLLDGMFTGRRNPMQAAMNGEISFSGDTAKAMTLSRVQADMERVYRATIDAVGAPGDLTAISAPDAAGGVRPAPPPSEPSGSDVREQIVAIVNELYAAELITATGGNVCARAETPGEAWITPSQLFKGDLHPEILVRIGMDGRALDAGERSPSSEAVMHAAVLEAKPEANAVIHCHAANATVLVNTGLPFLPISTEAAFFADIGRVPFVMPGTRDLAEAVVEAMGDGWAVLMGNHGLLVAGRSLRRAADMAEIIERTAEVIVKCHAVGREPSVLPPETVKMLAKMGDLMA